MTIEELHYAFKIGMDRVDKASDQDFQTNEIDWLLNEAQLKFINIRLNKTPHYESNQRTSDDLSPLHVKYPHQPYLVPTLIQTGLYEIKLDSLLYPYYRLLRINCESKKDNCVYTQSLRRVESDDINESLKDPFNSPSEDYILYNEGLSTDGSGMSLFIYAGSYTIDKIYVEYLRHPKRVFFGNYTYLDGSNPPAQNLEVSPSCHDIIVDMACHIASLNIQSPEYIQLRERKNLYNQ